MVSFTGILVVFFTVFLLIMYHVDICLFSNQKGLGILMGLLSFLQHACDVVLLFCSKRILFLLFWSLTLCNLQLSCICGHKVRVSLLLMLVATALKISILWLKMSCLLVIYWCRLPWFLLPFHMKSLRWQTSLWLILWGFLLNVMNWHWR